MMSASLGGKADIEIPALNQLDSGYSYNVHLPSQGDSTWPVRKIPIKRSLELHELFSKPVKSPQKAFRTYLAMSHSIVGW